jgi:ABC-2 type transport system permease protein
VLLGGLVVIAFFAANMVFQQSLARSESSAAHTPGGPLGTGFAGTASVARWTPPGLVAHSVADAAAGRYGIAALELGAGFVTVVLLAWGWIVALRRALEHPDGSTHATRRSRPRRVSRRAAGLLAAVPAVAPGWWPRILASRTLAAAGKEMRYYRRDPRRKQQLVSLVMPVLLVVVNSRIGLGVGMYAGLQGAGTGPAQHLPVWPAVLGGMIAGMFSSANLFGFDGSALWLNIAATSRWQDLRSDIAGKNIAGALITVPVFAVLYVVIGALAADPAGAAVAFAMAVCALGATSSVGSVTSVLLPTPIPERRSSAFSSGGAGQGCLAGLTTLAGLGATLALMIPVFLLIARWHPGTWLLVVAPGYGLLLAWVGRLVAATIAIRRLPELLARVSSLI